ncbi:hypothetical protein CBL_09041 [Carabus blaptoides fortunei]
MFGLLSFVLFILSAACLQLQQGAYEDLVVAIDESVPAGDCQTIVDNLKATLNESSQYLYNALDSRAYIRSVTVSLPASWPDSCVADPIVAGSGEQSDISIVTRGPSGSRAWTQQSAGCGQPGDQIYITYDSFRSAEPAMSRTLIKEFAKYRYGVFDEQGYDQDLVYPMCYREDESKPLLVTGCSDSVIQDNGICTNPSMPFNASDLVDPTSRSSIMFAAEAPLVSMFCDDGNHDRNAPTKHNFMCERRSTLEVILRHEDFIGNTVQHSNDITNTTPTIVFKRQSLTRYVLVIEDTNEMMIRESWTYLRNAIRKWAVYDLPSNTEVGLVMANESSASKLLNISSLIKSNVRDLVASNIPYTPGDSRAAACLQCALQDAIEMLKERNRTHGPASSVIVLIAPGMEHSHQMPDLAKEATASRIKIATINYPGVFRTQMLDTVATETGGVAYTVLEKKYNVDTSLLSTYFQLTNVMYSITQRFYQGNPRNLPVEIHRRELVDDRYSVTGSFVLDKDIGEPARFALYTHNVDSPLIRSLTLTSPSQVHYQAKSDSLLSVKIITIAASINETGTWTYKVERFSGNPQPHFIQVTATPRTSSSAVVRTKFWTGRNQPGGPLVLYAEVKKNERPVMGAKVEVTVSRPEYNGSTSHSEKFDLLDTGSGDPDVTKGDGIYTRYFSAGLAGGPGMYTFEVMVTDNGNTAYAVPENTEDTYDFDKPCCGTFIPTSKVQPISPFQRVLAPVTIFVTPEEILSASQLAVGRVGDLRAHIFVDEQKVKLTWSAPDMGGANVARYEVKYANSVQNITDNYETNAMVWDQGTPFPQSPGSETTFTLNFAQNPTMLLDRPLYFAVKSFSRISQDAGGARPISNWVRVFVASPPPPPTSSPIYPTMSVTSWPFNNHKSVNVEERRIASGLDLGLQLILPIVFGVVFLALIMAIYCYCCIVKPKRNGEIKSDKMSTVTIVPPNPNATSASANTTPQHNNAYTTDTNDHHTVGVPIYQDQTYDDEPTKKRLSIVHQQEQQLIDELKQQQQHLQQQGELRQVPGNYPGALSVISNNTLQRGGRTLSPYESWTASQLLHEHERRHSPSMMDELMQAEHQQMLPVHQQQPQQDHISITGQSLDHVSVNGAHFSVLPPPVPPLPSYNGYPVNYPIYGVHQAQPIHTVPAPNMYQSVHRNDMQFNSSLQGSLSSVHSGEKKRRNVTMV